MSRMPPAAAVARFALTVEGDAVVGHAAPESGRLPCALRLEADGEPIAIARATRFSTEAAAADLRLGWCGVRLDGLDAAAALADRVAVICVASGRLLLEAEVPPPAAPTSAAATLTIAALLAHARRDTLCADPAQILPFAEASLHRHGIPGLLDASFRTLLGRPCDPAIVAEWDRTPPPDAARAALRMVLTSPDYRDDPLRFIPGPFDPTFVFDLSPLDR